jgi:NitT/TauT family transport system permease protein
VTTSSKTAPRLFGVHAAPTGWQRLLLGILPFLLLVIIYLWASDARLAENPDDKLLPGLSQMIDAMAPLVTQEDPRTGKYIFFNDTAASLVRLACGSLSALAVALLLGLNMGAFRGLEATASPFTVFVAMIPPLALLPILFITLGVDELGKITLIFVGTMPIMTRDIFIATKSLPKEHLVKTLTLGGSQPLHR